MNDDFVVLSKEEYDRLTRALADLRQTVNDASKLEKQNILDSCRNVIKVLNTINK